MFLPPVTTQPDRSLSTNITPFGATAAYRPGVLFPAKRFCGCGLERESTQDPPLRTLTGALTGTPESPPAEVVARGGVRCVSLVKLGRPGLRLTDPPCSKGSRRSNGPNGISVKYREDFR